MSRSRTSQVKTDPAFPRGEGGGGEGAIGVLGIGAGVLLLTREIDRAIVNVGRESVGFDVR